MAYPSTLAPDTPVGTLTVVLYLDLIKKCLTNWIYGRQELRPYQPAGRVDRLVDRLVHRWHKKRGVFAMQPAPMDESKRMTGLDWPVTAHTMIGLNRLDNLQQLIESILAEKVDGDLIETGVWRGGATIFMRAALKAYGVTDRTIWVADSFHGLPKPDAAKYPVDAGDLHHTVALFAVSRQQVEANFAAYGLLDANVQFLEGWFSETLPNAPIDRLALIRLDGDMYGSTMDALTALYPKLSVRGYVIIDDYGDHEGCRKAVHDYRDAHGIADEITMVDCNCCYWRKSPA
jgi:O-methyltransferase